MNSISSLGALASSYSPRTMMNQKLDAAVQSGTISATDETAMETALDAIDSSLGIGSSSGSSSASATAKLDPSSMKARIDDLIQQQVDAGTLTTDQASALQSFFAQGAPSADGSGTTGGDAMAMSGVSGTSGPGGMAPMGPPPPPPGNDPDGDGDTDSSSSSTDTDSTTTQTASATDQIDALISFLNNLRESLASQNTYSGSSSSSASDSSSTAFVIDALA